MMNLIAVTNFREHAYVNNIKQTCVHTRNTLEDWFAARNNRDKKENMVFLSLGIGLK